jgi:hypothetical protein
MAAEFPSTRNMPEFGGAQVASGGKGVKDYNQSRYGDILNVVRKVSVDPATNSEQTAAGL